MDLKYTQEEEDFRLRVRQWLAERLDGPFAVVRGKGAPGREHEAVDARIAWEQELGAGGFIGMSWPRAFGGQDFTLTEQLVFWEEYAIVGAPGRIGVVGDWLLGPTLIAHGTRAQQQRFLPRILDGTERWCQGYSEPDAGSDLASLRTRAERDGDQWVVNGHKIDLDGAPRALGVRPLPDRARRQPASRHLVPPRPDGPARHRSPADP
jgi:alkylation response protein AidB-like acyl-CoA dehydrogenase